VLNSSDEYQKAYLVLGGEGWRLRKFFIEELELHMTHRSIVHIVTLEKFIGLANRKNL
jgi:hypothetical protein